MYDREAEGDQARNDRIKREREQIAREHQQRWDAAYQLQLQPVVHTYGRLTSDEYHMLMATEQDII